MALASPLSGEEQPRTDEDEHAREDGLDVLARQLGRDADHKEYSWDAT